jgi:hypothetical protein
MTNKAFLRTALLSTLAFGLPPVAAAANATPRKAKMAMHGLYPELISVAPTSPSYDSPPAVK